MIVVLFLSFPLAVLPLARVVKGNGICIQSDTSVQTIDINSVKYEVTNGRRSAEPRD